MRTYLGQKNFNSNLHLLVFPPETIKVNLWIKIILLNSYRNDLQWSLFEQQLDLAFPIKAR